MCHDHERKELTGISKDVASPLCGFDLTSNFAFLVAFRAQQKLSQKLLKFGLSEQAKPGTTYYAQLCQHNFENK